MTSSHNRFGIVSWDFFHPKGGMGRSLRWIADVLLRDAVVIAGSPVIAPAQTYGVEPLLPFTRFFGGHLLFSLLLPLRLSRFIRSHRITGLLLPVGPGGVFLFRKPRGVRLIVCAYHTYVQQARLVPGQSWKKIFVPWERRTLRMADTVLCFSTDTKHALIADHAIDPARIRFLPHAIDASWRSTRFVTKEDGLCVCIARLEMRKGVETLLRAWSEVHRALPNARLLIIGRGAGTRRIDACIRRIGSSVSRIGHMSFAELQRRVRSAEIAVCPAYLEGFGLACAEAMTAGTPVIASDTDGLRCLISHGETGWLVPAGDSSALAECIIRILRDGDAKKRVARAAATNGRKTFDPANCALLLRAAIFEA